MGDRIEGISGSADGMNAEAATTATTAATNMNPSDDEPGRNASIDIMGPNQILGSMSPTSIPIPPTNKTKEIKLTDSQPNSPRRSRPTPSIPTLFASTTTLLPSPSGQFAALPAEIFEMILHSILTEALVPSAGLFAKFDPPAAAAQRGIRSLAQVNGQMKLLVQRELTHFFSRWAAGRLANGCEWWRIATAYNELRQKGFGSG